MPRPRYSVRRMMILVLILGVALGWVVFRARVQRDVVAEIRRAGGFVYYSWEMADGHPISQQSLKPWTRLALNLLGPDFNGHVVFAHIERGKVGETNDSLLAQVSRLGQLEDLECSVVEDDGLAQLRGLTHLKRLCIVGPKITGAGLSVIKRMVNLEELELQSPRISDTDLGQIAGKVSLKRLRLGAPMLTDAGLEYVLLCPNLEELTLFNPGMTEAALRTISRMPKLKSLEIHGGTIRDFAALKGKQGLTSLDLRGLDVDDDDLAAIAAIPDLEHLDLGITGITDAGLHHLASLGGLTRLNLDTNFRITDSSIVDLLGMAGLRQVALFQTKITPAGVAAVKLTRPKLQILY